MKEVEMDSEDLVGCREAAKRLGVSPVTLRRRVNRGELATYIDPLDDRRKLVRIQDLDALRQPRSTQERKEANAA